MPPLLWDLAQDYSRDLAIQLSFIPALQEYCRDAPEDLAATLSKNPLWKPFQEIDYAMSTGHDLDDYFDTEKSKVFLHLMDSIPQLSLSDENAILMTASQNHGSLNVLCRLVMFKTDFDPLVKELGIDESALIEKYADDENIQNCITCSLAERMDKVDNPLREKHLRGWWDKVPTNPTLFALDLNTSRQVLLEDNEQQHTARNEIALTQTHKRR